MNNLVSNKETMSSLQIAEIAGKPHNDVLKAIRAMEPAWVKITKGNFSLSEYKDSTGRLLPMYQLSKTECLYIATKFNDEARAKLVIRWEQLEVEKQNGGFEVPTSFRDALLLAAKQQEQIEEQQKVITEQAPKVSFANAIIASKTSCLIGELAKLLAQNGVGIGQNRLFEWMRNNGYLGKTGERYNIPNQLYIEQGLFELRKGVRSGSDGVMHTTITTKVTGKGQEYFINKFLYKQQQEINGGNNE